MRERIRRRMFPLIASVGLVLVGMLTTTWGSTLLGRSQWALPYDLWGTLIATTRLAHGNIGGLYAPPTGLISLPGAAIILLPCAALITAFHLSLAIPGTANLHPAVWLLAGPYQIAIGCLPLFAADALAERLEVPRWTRGLLALAGAGILWSVCARWGHPEDAVAIGLLLYAVLAQGNGRTALAGWLAGAAVCVQPLVLLAVPIMLALLPWRRMPAFLVRAALPSAVLIAAAAIANWHDTYRSVTSQPDSPVVNHPTLWTSLAPHMAGQNVAAGPFRLATILLACLCALAIRRRWAEYLSREGSPREPKGAPVPGLRSSPASRGARRRLDRGARRFVPSDEGRRRPQAPGGEREGTAVCAERRGKASATSARRRTGERMPADLLAAVLWWVAFTLALRSFFEPVMVSYYPWPPMAVALIPAATLGWRRLLVAGLLAGGLTGAAQGPSHAVWIWWAPLVAGLIVLLALSWPRRPRAQAVYMRMGGETGVSVGRLAVTPSPEEVPCSRRFTHGARYSLAHRASSRRAASQGPRAVPLTAGRRRSSAGDSRQSSVTGTPSTSQARSATR
jgi:hypothetical protein